MIKTRRFEYSILIFGLIILALLAACRPASDQKEFTTAQPAPSEIVTQVVAEPLVEQQDETDTPEASNTPEPTSVPTEEPNSENKEPEEQVEETTVEELVAMVPTPKPNSIVPTPATLIEEEVAVRGAAGAPVTIVEFSDYQCPYCLKYYQETYPQIIEKYVETGQVRYIFKDFPLEQLHPQAGKAAEAARCAGELGKYWEMHEALFENQASWAGQEDPIPALVELASSIGLNADSIETCLIEGRFLQAVQTNLIEGQLLNATGTPTFFIDGYPIVGARPFQLFELAFALASEDRLDDAFAQEPTPEPVPIEQIPIGDAPMLGDPDAPVLIIEYSDYQCPYCARYSTDTFQQIRENYIETGQVRYVFKDFPLSFHAQAQKAAEAAHCAGDLGDYWGMHDLLYANQAEWGNENAIPVFQGFAQELGLDSGTFNECLDSGIHAAAISANLQEGVSVGVTGTPGFFVGGQFISGAQPYSAFEQAIQTALEQ
ncbi:MAG: thioredoxin domain-containing protein [Anaerolineales bacterium]|nr:thioredoxin domain-containing protein [Anaerolineales bacterium]